MTACGRASLRALVLLAAVLAPAGVQAQDYDMSAAWGGGVIQFAPFVESGSATDSEIGFGLTPVGVLHFENWMLDRWVGLRFGGFYSAGNVSYPTSSKTQSVWGLEGAALLRVAPAARSRMATAYLMAGGGVAWFEMGDGPAPIPIQGTNTVVYDPDDMRQWMALGGAGIEILPGWRAYDGTIGVRLEAVDQVMFGRPLSVEGGGDPGMMHNLRFSLTLFSGVPRLF
jgi:hypothetical protein